MPARAPAERDQREGRPRAAVDVLRQLIQVRPPAPRRLAWIALLALAGCDAGEPDLQLVDSPPLRVLDVRATTGVDADGLPVREPLAVDGSTADVWPTTGLVIRFERFLEPVSVARQSFCLSGTTTPVATPADCVEGRVFEQPVYDPVHRTATLYLPAGETLPLATKHTLTLLAPPAEEGDLIYGFRAFDHAPLEATTVFQFTTIDADPGGPQEGLGTRDRFCSDGGCLDGSERSEVVQACRAGCDAADQDCLDACCPGTASFYLGGCSFATCHAPRPEPPLGAAMGLNMQSADFIRLTAIAKTAHQTQQGEHADDPDQNPLRFGRAMPIIDPRNAGNSYLLYKAMAHPDFLELSGDRLDPAEHARMRSGIVVGMPMPALPNSSVSKLQAYELLSTWIAQGAQTPVCP